MSAPSPSSRVAAELRRRIASGELAQGARVPSTRQLAADARVAPATAAKALGLLKQEGLVRAEPRAGTIVAGPRRRARTSSSGELSRASIVSAAIAVADAEGIAAVTMRSVASAAGAPAMSIYRHVPS
jgi:DNA-binding GntR family transcriptional regulator